MLKDMSGRNLQPFEYLLIWRREEPPTLQDFKLKYQDLLYEPWHEEDLIVELIEKP